MNRAARRKLAAHARELSVAVVDRGLVLAGDDGGLARVSDVRAKRILARQVERCLKAGGRPVVRRLSEPDAAVFPHVRSGPHCPAWLAVALGADGGVSVVVRRIGYPFDADADPVLEEYIARELLLSELRCVAVSSDIPGMANVAGSA